MVHKGSHCMVASNKECPYLQAPSQSSGALLYGSVCAGGGVVVQGVIPRFGPFWGSSVWNRF